MAKLSDPFLIGAARQYDEIGQQIRKLEAERTDLRDTIIGELDRRNAKTAEYEGYKVTAIQATSTAFDVDVAKSTLPRARFAAITKVIIDRHALDAEIEARRITEDQANAFTQRSPKGAKYPRLTVPKTIAAAG